MNQQKTPLYDQLIKHKQQNPISFHVPGHKYGTIYNEPANHSYFKEIMSLDATELAGLDDLHSPEGVIFEAERLLADLYKVEKSFFLVNGSTIGNLAMLLAAIEERDTVLVQRNCHKSILNGLELTKAKPVFLDPEYHQDWGVPGGVTVEIVNEALNQFNNVKSIILTYPNYYGMVNQLEKIIEIAHERNIPILVDEAHGAHFISGGFFPKSAVELGADIVVHSAHKTLPAMTMGSYLQFNSKLISLEKVEKYLQILQSSSPSYPIMASLDLARNYLATYLEMDHSYLQEQIYRFKKQLKEIGCLHILDYDDVGDLLKVTIQSATDLNGFQMQSLLEKNGIFVELADPYNILFVLPLLKKDMYYPFNEVAKLIKEIFKGREKRKTMIPFHSPLPKISTLAIEYRDVEHSSKRQVSLKKAVGMIAADCIIPYPPGIPLIYPGEVITQQVVDQLDYLVSIGANSKGIWIYTRKG